MNPRHTLRTNGSMMIKPLSASRRKRGIALIVVLVALTIVVGVLLPLIPPALRARRQVELEEIALQNEFLKSAVLQRLLRDPIPERSGDQELSNLSGLVRFGRAESLHGNWSVRRAEQDKENSMELEVIVRLEFNESPESGSSPWLIPKSEIVFPFPTNPKMESKL